MPRLAGKKSNGFVGAILQNRKSMPPVRLQVYVQPPASRTELAGMHDGVIKIRISAAPVENAANLALIDFVAQHLGIAKRYVRVVSGHVSRSKVLHIDGVSAAVIAARLGKRSDLEPTPLMGVKRNIPQ